MTTWDLARLRYTVRKITGKFDQSQLPDTCQGQPTLTNPPGVDDYINDFYLLDLPEHLRSLKLKQFFTFTSLPNVGTYRVPQTIYQLDRTIYVDGYPGTFYESPDQFYSVWPEYNFVQQDITTSTGLVGPYTFTLSSTPIQQGTVTIGIAPNPTAAPSVSLETFVDADTPVDLAVPSTAKFTNTGTLTGNLGGSGTINYLTGAVSILYGSAPALGLQINAHYRTYVASRPRDIMFYQQQLFLRPIPDDAYLIKLVSYIQPTVAIANSWTTKEQFDGTATDMALFNEWWQLIAYGAALKIFIEDGDHEQANAYKPYFEEQKILAERRTLKELSNMRIPTRYAPQMTGGIAGPGYPLY